MLKLTKLKNTQWMGNGMGTATAEWAVKGHEHIQLRQVGYAWMAFDTRQELHTRLARAYTRRELLEILFTKLETA